MRRDVQLRAMAMARCSIAGAGSTDPRTTLRCWAMKPPARGSRTRASLIGVIVEREVVDVLGQRKLGDCELVFD